MRPEHGCGQWPLPRTWRDLEGPACARRLRDLLGDGPSIFLRVAAVEVEVAGQVVGRVDLAARTVTAGRTAPIEGMGCDWHEAAADELVKLMGAR